MARMTALDARAPTVKWGYLYLNQADKAPGYDPPTVIHWFLSDILYILLAFIYPMKNAKSLRACSEFKYFRFSRLSESFPKGKLCP